MKLGYTIIWVNDVIKTVEFYEKAFGLVRRTLKETDKSIWAEVTTLAANCKQCSGSISDSHKRLAASGAD